MSLSQDPVFDMLKSDFVVGVRDITGQPWAGASGRHDFNGSATGTTDGAGSHNIQMFVLAPDGTVIHCLPGYWAPKDMAFELAFAQQLNKVYTNPNIPLADKRKLASAMQLDHIKKHSVAMQVRSRMQPFDAKFELARSNADHTVIRPPLVGKLLARTGFGLGGIVKSTDGIMHERMARQPFVAYEQFDVASFTDYGRQFYDRNENGLQNRVLAKVESTILRPRRKQTAQPVACPAVADPAVAASESSTPKVEAVSATNATGPTACPASASSSDNEPETDPNGPTRLSRSASVDPFSDPFSDPFPNLASKNPEPTSVPPVGSPSDSTSSTKR